MHIAPLSEKLDRLEAMLLYIPIFSNAAAGWTNLPAPTAVEPFSSVYLGLQPCAPCGYSGSHRVGCLAGLLSCVFSWNIWGELTVAVLCPSQYKLTLAARDHLPPPLLLGYKNDEFAALAYLAPSRSTLSTAHPPRWRDCLQALESARLFCLPLCPCVDKQELKVWFGQVDVYSSSVL